MIEVRPTDTQDYINYFCHDIIAMNVARVISTYSKKFGKPRDPIRVPYHDLFDDTYPIPLYKKRRKMKDSDKYALGLSWKRGRSVLDSDSFRNWDNGGNGRTKPQNNNDHVLINGLD